MADNYGTEVRLLGYTIPTDPKLHTPESLVEYAGRLCWDSTDKLGTNKDRIKGWIEVGHTSLLEHVSITFYIRASRVFTHQLVRHRIASFSQRSMRFVKELEPRFITPPNLTPSQLQVFLTAMQDAWDAYHFLLKSGLKPDQARYVLPNGTETQIVMTMNTRELRHFISLRNHKRASDEMREVASKIKDICKQVCPQIFEDL